MLTGIDWLEIQREIINLATFDIQFKITTMHLMLKKF